MNFLDEYIEEDREVVFHEDDPHLDTIRIPLPRLEEWYSKVLKRPVSREEALTFVDGYGLPAKQQKFTRQVMPEKLKIIYEVVFNKKHAVHKARYKEITDVKLEDIYEEIENNQKYYKNEIDWIKLQIKRGYLGYWCFIKGKPTYLTGRNYKFLNFWLVKKPGKPDNNPDYRDYQRQIFHAFEFFENTDLEFYKHKIMYRAGGKGNVLFTNANIQEIKERLEELGASEWIPEWNANVFRKSGKRVFHGINFVSGRRVAKTASSCAYCTFGTLEMPDQTFIIQAMNEDQAVDKIFIKQIQWPVNKLPFFLRPHNKGKLESKAGMAFQYEGSMAVAARAGIVEDAMECFIKPLPATEKAADGEAEIRYVYRDEPAKKTDKTAQDQDIPTWWNNTMKPATERGENIVGFTIMPSTVGNMDTGGGAQFFEITNNSHYLDRNENGRTPTGLVNILLPGYYAVEGYLDEYGYSIIDDPQEPVMGMHGKMITQGAKTYLKNQAAYYERKRMWKELIELQQNFPPTWQQAFAVIPKDMGMPIELMRDRISELRFGKPITTRVDFKWVGDKFGGDVRVEDNPKGKWVMSYLPPLEHRNRRTVVSAEEGYIAPPDKSPIYAPDISVMNKFFLSCDPVKFHKHNTVGKKKSKAAASVYYKRDTQVDPDGKPREEWVSQDFILHYLEEVTDKDIYHEEWLKVAIFLGAHVYPEWPDGEAVCEYFRFHGFDGYLLRDAAMDGRPENRPGVYAGDAEKNDMAGDMMTFFANNVKYMKHLEIIEEWTQMRGIDDLTNHDLCACSGWGIRAAKSRMPEIYKETYMPVELERGFDFFDVD